MILEIKNAKLPLFRFEYHPQTGKVYWMRRPLRAGEQVQAFVLAEHCDTEARAFGFVQTWCRGYHEGLQADRQVLAGEST